MSWKKYSSRYREELFSLLIEKEYEALSFSSRFISRPKFQIAEKKETVFIYTDVKDRITAALMITKNGQLLPLVEDSALIQEINFKEAVKNMGTSVYYINSIMGEKNAVDSVNKAVSEIINHDKLTEYIYHVMVINKSSDYIPPDYISDRSLIIRKPGTEDIPKLIPLQEMYEKEEVLPSGSLFDPALAKKYIQNSVKNRISAVCEISGRIVSKANTNGDGINYSQIGGVFTLPEFRNRGIGKKVTGKLVEKIIEQGKKPSLFVKQNNLPAASVYLKLGFTIKSSFKITLFFLMILSGTAEFIYLHKITILIIYNNIHVKSL